MSGLGNKRGKMSIPLISSLSNVLNIRGHHLTILPLGSDPDRLVSQTRKGEAGDEEDSFGVCRSTSPKYLWRKCFRP